MNDYTSRYHSPTREQLRELQHTSEHRHLSREFIADRTFAIWLESTRYAPNHQVVIRNSCDGWGRDIRGLYDNGFWKFSFPSEEYPHGMEFKFFLDGAHWMQGANLRHPGAYTQIVSDRFVSFPSTPTPASQAPPFVQPPIPNLPSGGVFQIWFRTEQFAQRRITLRNHVDGWGNDIHGVYQDGAWKFRFPAHPRYAAGLQFKFVLDGNLWIEGPNLSFPGRSLLVHTEREVVFDRFTPRFRHSFDRLVVEESVKQQNYIRNHYDEDTNFDVIIVGSGMGGGILADALSNAGLDTLVLEAGSLTHESHTYNLPTGEAGPEGARYRVGHYTKHDPNNSGFQDEVTMNFGGRSVFWSGLIPRMQAHELQQWPAEVAQYLQSTGYADAERLMRKFVTFGPFEERMVAQAAAAFPEWNVVHTPRADHQPEFRPNGSQAPTSYIVRSTGLFSTADLLLDSLSTRGPGGAEHLYINANHLVTHLEQTGRKITGVVCEDLIGLQRRRFHASAYVLAAGSMESVRIALNSGLDADHPIIGRGFSDHPAFFIGYDGKDIFIPPSSPWFGNREHARIFFYPTGNSPADLPCNVEINLNGRFWTERHSDNDVLDHRINSSDRTTVNIKFSFAYPLDEGNFIRRGQAGKLSVHVARMQAQAKWEPAVRAMSKRILDFFGVQINDLGPYMGFGNGGTPHHAGGSMRMGENGKPRVVDTNLKFANRENLYVCDPSVYPMIPAANPALTLAALSLRLAKHLHGRLRP